MTADSTDPIWQQLLEVGQMERHFNQLQASYRALASTWLLATFAGIGFTVVNAKSMPIDWLAVATGVAASGAVGIALLWNLDLLVYHRLLDVMFFTGRKIEMIHQEQPPFRIHMLRLFSHVGVVGHVIWFYMLGTDLLIAIGTATASIEFAQRQMPWPVAAAGGGAVLAVTTLGMWLATRRYRNEMRIFFDIPKTSRRKRKHVHMLNWDPSSATWTDTKVSETAAS